MLREKLRKIKEKIEAMSDVYELRDTFEPLEVHLDVRAGMEGIEICGVIWLITTGGPEIWIDFYPERIRIRGYDGGKAESIDAFNPALSEELISTAEELMGIYFPTS